MGRIFDYDNVFFRMMGKLVDVFFVSLLWLTFSIPIVTIGASTQALYYTVHKQIKGGRGYVWQEFFSSFKDHWKANILLTLIFEVLITVLGYERLLLRTMAENGGGDNLRIMYFVLVFFQFLIGAWAIFTFCYRARFIMDWKNSLKNGLLLMLGYLPRALLVMVTLAVAMFLIYLLPILICIVPCLLFLLYEVLLEKVFLAIMKPEDVEQEEQLSMEQKRDHE